MTGMDEFLKELEDSQTEETEAETAEETEETTEQEAEEKATESEETTGEEEGSTPEPEKQREEDPTVPRRALEDERRKRQELERRIQEFESKKEGVKGEDFYEDPEKAITGLRSEFQNALLNERMNISEGFARKRWEDLDEKFETFKGMLDESPALRDQMLKHSSPWEFMGEQVERYERLKDFESFDKEREKLQAEFDRTLEAKAKELADKILEERESKRKTIPGSAADVRSAAGNKSATEAAEAAPPSLEEVLGR